MELMRAKGITVSFGGIDVVASVDLTLRKGEVHAITGENGAGKSSLGKAMAGVYRPRLGTIELDARTVSFRNPREALAAGIALIHQEPLTFPDLTVTESIFAGNLIRKGPFVDWTACHCRAKDLLTRLGVDLDPQTRVGTLSIAKRQLLELASGLAHEAKVWIFDETTAPLTPKEVAELFRVVRQLKEDGCAIAIISHHLHEVFEISDRVTVLRDGAKVAEKLISETTPEEIVRLMVGRELSGERFRESALGEVVMDVESLSGPGFHDVSFQIRAGEIVGVAGLVGAGRTELARALFGITQPTSGAITVNGNRYLNPTPQESIRRGIALVPEDRIHDGLIQPHSIASNVALASLANLGAYGFPSADQITATVEAETAKLNLKRSSISQPVSELSGGNQQKVVLAKWLLTSPKLLILDEPTRGVDVGAKHEVHRIIRELADQGLAVLLISSDLKEILSLSARILVLRQGHLAAEFSQENATQEAIMRHAAGQEAHA